MRKIALHLLALGLTVLAGCASKPAETLALKIAVNDIYCTDTACFCVHDVAARGYAASLEQLRAEHGIALEFTYFAEPYQLEEAIVSGQYDGVLSKPWTALRLQKQAKADFRRIVDVLDPGNNRWLSGSVIVPVDSPLQSLDELTGKHVYLGQPDAYEKHQAAKRLFGQRGIQPAKIDTHASCSENIGELLDGKADAAVISDYALSADCAVDFANPEEFRTLGRTEQIPLTSLMLDMNKVDDAAANRLTKALLSISGRKADAALLSKGFVPPAAWNPPELENAP
ncbi:phosphate/phosphite/phosphonate ABC transporter substrate-binding protein [Pontiella sp.]|uniref:phosphate/phosphite/phosphonate ABC transporter substrate-binding protein n=1 Tax=Pontiella sp. TaxID=2837462 RepID=UPI003566040E